MHGDYAIIAILDRRDECATASSTTYDVAPKFLRGVREAKVACCIPDVDVRHSLGEEDKATSAISRARSCVADLELVPQERDAGRYYLPEVILDLRWNEHLGSESHGASGIAAPEQVARITGPFVTRRTNSLGGFHQRAIGEQRQELDGIEDVGFAYAVRPGDARERAEVHRKIREILEAVDLQTSQHQSSLQASSHVEM